MKTIKGESFEVELQNDNSTAVFRGALRLSGMEDYAPILELLKSTLAGIPTPIVLDLRELDFLNNLCLIIFCIVVLRELDQIVL